MARKAVGDAMQDVADHRAGRRGDDPDDARQIRQQLLARGVEQALGGKLRCRRSSSSAISAPTPAGSSDSMMIW